MNDSFVAGTSASSLGDIRHMYIWKERRKTKKKFGGTENNGISSEPRSPSGLTEKASLIMGAYLSFYGGGEIVYFRAQGMAYRSAYTPLYPLVNAFMSKNLEEEKKSLKCLAL